MGKKEKTNDEKKKELLVLAYDTWWKLRAIRNMASLRVKAMPEIYFDDDTEKKELANVVLALLNGLDAELILDISKDYKKQYLKAGSPPFDIALTHDWVSSQKDAEVKEE